LEANQAIGQPINRSIPEEKTWLGPPHKIFWKNVSTQSKCGSVAAVSVCSIVLNALPEAFED
jgi:hypothetical protein